jgi:hypothetical protein
MDESFRVFCATIAGEAIGCSPATWRAIASVIINRVGVREWHRYLTPLAVIANSGFDAFAQENPPYKAAYKAFGSGWSAGLSTRLARLVDAVTGIYEGTEKPTTDAVLYYSPKAQSALHKSNPAKYRERPPWNFDELEQVVVRGTEGDDFVFFRYKVAA